MVPPCYGIFRDCSAGDDGLGPIAPPRPPIGLDRGDIARTDEARRCDNDALFRIYGTELPLTRIDDPLHDREVGTADATQDNTRTDDTRISAVRPLISPALLQDELPVSAEIQTLVEDSRARIADVLHGRDDRLVLVVGPCSIHDHAQAMEYARQPRAAADQYRDDLLVVMRVYFEKPRTTVGWKGYINDPRLDGSFRINEGLRRARELLLDISGLGLPIATEFLDLLSPQYIADLIAWAPSARAPPKVPAIASSAPA